MKRGLLFALALAVVFFGAMTAQAQAQATRTWVSGVGDDANPCSRTAPCKTFAGAISKTAECGEIDALDPGGFGAVTITKGITIDGGGGEGGQVASVLVAGTNGIVVAVSSSTCQKVTLRNLDIQGINSGLSGVNITAAQGVSIENMSIYGFTQYGINMQPSVHSNLTVYHSNIENNASGGIISSTTTGVNRVAVFDSKIHRSGVGITVGANTDLDLTNSIVVQCASGGLLVNASTGQATSSNSTISNNQVFGVEATTGGTVRLANTTVSNNNGTGLLASGGNILTWSNNYVGGNLTDGSRTGTILPQ